MIAARVKQTRSANRKRQAAPFDQGDLVYISSKNIKFEKGLARKLIPKFIGPYVITQDFGNNSFQIDLPANMKQRGGSRRVSAEKDQRQRKGSASEKGPAPAETAAPAKGRGSGRNHSPRAWDYVTSCVTKVPGAGGWRSNRRFTQLISGYNFGSFRILVPHRPRKAAA
jgi:hypothetical protein